MSMIAPADADDDAYSAADLDNRLEEAQEAVLAAGRRIARANQRIRVAENGIREVRDIWADALDASPIVMAAELSDLSAELQLARRARGAAMGLAGKARAHFNRLIRELRESAV